MVASTAAVANGIVDSFRSAKFIATEWKSSISIEIGMLLINRTTATLEYVLNKILSLAELLIAHSVR